MQSLVSPLLAHSGSTKPTEGGPAVTTLLAKICHSDVADPAGKAHRTHGDCCILCGSGVRDAALFLAVAWAATALAPLIDPPASVPVFERADVRPYPSGWASSWSSRAPPSFS